MRYIGNRLAQLVGTVAHLEYLDKRMWRTYRHSLHYSTPFEQRDSSQYQVSGTEVPLTFEHSCRASSVLD
jgi:hypothetical protein